MQQTPPSAPSPRRAPCVVGCPAGGGARPATEPALALTRAALLAALLALPPAPAGASLAARTRDDTTRPGPPGGGEGSDSAPAAIRAWLGLAARMLVLNSRGRFCVPLLWTRKTDSFFRLEKQQWQNQISCL